MIEVEQTDLTETTGNCLAACLASVFSLPLEQVPVLSGGDWFDRLNDWLAPRNLMAVTFPVSEQYRPRGYAILGAQSPRGPWLHAVVCKDGELIWDPHPKREMGVGEWVDWTVFQLLDPSVPTQAAMFLLVST